MSKDTKIQWCDHTFNPWRGCTKVSAGCANCYAEAQAKRNPGVLGEWGPSGTRVVASEAMWREPLKWDRQAREAGERRRVFCASMADVFEDRPELIGPRVRLRHLIAETPHLDWLLLTKRPENVRAFCNTPRSWTENMPPNVWIGTSVENQATAETRIPELLQISATVRFLSVEPLLEEVDLSQWFGPQCPWGCGRMYGLGGMGCTNCEWCCEDEPPRIHWVIVGGESGPGARPCHASWIRRLVTQCRRGGVPCFVKQFGAFVVDTDVIDVADHWPDSFWSSRFTPVQLPGFGMSTVRVNLTDPKGGDPEEWLEYLRVREFPSA